MALDDMVAEWQVAKATLEAAKERYDKITNDIAQQMLVEGVKSDLVHVHGTDYKVTVVQSETLKVDEDSLVKALGKRMYNKVSVRKVDKKMLELAIKDGEISPQAVANSMVISKSTPYIRVSQSTGEPE
jgi:transcriptional antiterminator Rof (Rho-off)